MRETRIKQLKSSLQLTTAIVQQIGIFAMYLVQAVGLSFPLIMDLSGSLIGKSLDLDRASFVWNLWWVRRALLDLHTNPLFSDYIFYPFTVDLRFHNLALFNGLMSIPFQPIMGVVGAFNLISLLTIAFNGYATYLLGKHVMSQSGLAILTGALVGFNPALLSHIRAGKAPFAAIWPVALSLLLLIRFSHNRHLRDSIGLGLVMLIALLIDFQILLYTALWLGLYGMYQVISNPSMVFNRRFALGALLALIIVGTPFFGIFFPVLANADALGYPIPSAQATRTYSLQAKLFISPWFMQVTFGTVLPVMALGALICLPFVKRSRFWLISGLIFLILALGVVLHPTEIPLPYAWLRKLPGVAQFRTPYRFNIPATLGLAVGVGVVLTKWESRLNSKKWEILLTPILLVLILIDSRMIAPFVAEGYPDIPIYHRIAQEDGDFVVLEIPVGVRSGTKIFGQGEDLQFYQMMHGKRIINAMVARVPRRMFNYYNDSPFLSLFAGEKVSDRENVEADFTNFLRDRPIGYVIVHSKMLEPDLLAQIEGLLSNHPELNLIETTPNVQVYKVVRVNTDNTSPTTNDRDTSRNTIDILFRSSPDNSP